MVLCKNFIPWLSDTLPLGISYIIGLCFDSFQIYHVKYLVDINNSMYKNLFLRSITGS